MPRSLWQLPAFLLGLAALFGLWNHGDKLRPSVTERYQRALEILRASLERWPPDVDQLQAALRRLPKQEVPPEFADRAHFFTGSAYVALAESTTSSAEAAEWWRLAKDHLEAIPATTKLQDPDVKKLRYRLARVWANTPDIPAAKTLEALKNTVGSGDDTAEGYRLLAELYRKITPPDDASERNSWRDYLKHAPTRADARLLNQARVRLAELHEKLGEGEEARKVLERVGPEAPPEVYASSRLMLAKYFIAEENWAQAAVYLEQVRDMKGATDPQRGQALSQLVEAYTRLNQSDKANDRAKESEKFSGGYGKLVGLKQAEVQINDETIPREQVVASLEKSMSVVTNVADYPSDMVPIAEARRTCEEVIRKTRAANEFALADRANKAYARIAENGKHHRIAAELNETWGEEAAKDPARLEESRQHFRQAAEACAELAKLEKNAPERGDWLRKAATFHVKGEDRTKALAVLSDLVSRISDYPEDRTGQAWAEMGEIYLKAGDKEQAKLAYQNASGRAGPARPLSRVRHAVLSWETSPNKEGDTVIPLLEEALEQPDLPSKHKDAHEEALYALGECLLIRQDWAKAEARLRAALELYPDSPRAISGRLQFGQCFRAQAHAEGRKVAADQAALEKIKAERISRRQPSYQVDEQLKLEDRIQATTQRFYERLRLASDSVCQAEEKLLKAPMAEPELLRRASFYAADCATWLGDFEDAAGRYERMAERYKNRAEQLEALRDLHRCCCFGTDAAREKKDAAGAKRWIIRTKLAYENLAKSLAQIPESELNGSTDARKRSYWEKWLEQNAARKND
ncbi:tetratricopeptide repeat protein [Zavarzinella formosa]|uniref:tetratricopeptide repeat protein n=1 Tax=Zavarzinella formosa TaxID=360055 RepID=UPI0012F9514A|nr:tetratricopeptide repeat protein [Zavarzinella formosa]